jgi:hypothetical protein
MKNLIKVKKVKGYEKYSWTLSSILRLLQKSFLPFFHSFKFTTLKSNQIMKTMQEYNKIKIKWTFYETSLYCWKAHTMHKENIYFLLEATI